MDSQTETLHSTMQSATEIIAQPLTLPCSLTLPNRLVKCPMQETQAKPPYFDPPIETFKNLYATWGESRYGTYTDGHDIFLNLITDAAIARTIPSPTRSGKLETSLVT